MYFSLFLALGKAKEDFILGACRQGICFPPVIFILTLIWGMNGIIYAQPVSDMLSATITMFMALNVHKHLNSSSQKSMNIEAANVNPKLEKQ